MSRGSTLQIHCKTVFPSVHRNRAVLKMQMPGDFVAHWRLLPYLRVNFLELHHLGGVRRAGKFHATATATLKSSNRVCHCCFSVLDHSLNLQSNPAVIVRHRIVKPRLADELAAVEDARHRHRFLHRLSVQLANLVSSCFIL